MRRGEAKIIKINPRQEKDCEKEGNARLNREDITRRKKKQRSKSPSSREESGANWVRKKDAGARLSFASTNGSSEKKGGGKKRIKFME